MRTRIALAALVAAGCGTPAVMLAALVDPPRPEAASAPPGRFELVGRNPLLARGMNSALALHGSHAYVGSRTDGTHPNSGILVLDVADPRRPEIVHQIGPPAAANPGESQRELRVWPEQDLLIVLSFECDELGHLCLGSGGADRPPTVRFFDIAGERAARPELVSTYRLPDNPHEFFLWVDPRDPARALLYVTTPFVQGAEIDRGGEHLLVTDISGARRGEFEELARWTPKRESKWEQAALHSLSVSPDGRRAFLADLQGGFLIADTSDLARGRANPAIRQLTAPENAVHHESPGAHSALQLPGRPYALITDEVYGQGFGLGPLIGFNVLKGCPWGWARVVGIRDPAVPRLLAEHKVLPWNDAARCGSVPLLKEHGASFSSHNPTLSRHLGLVTWHSAGLRALDLSDPAAPREAAAFVTGGLPWVEAEDPALSLGDRVVAWSYPIVKDGLIYFVDLRNGLYVMRYRGPFATELQCFALLEGNSNATARRPCGPPLRLRVRCRRRGRSATIAGPGIERVRRAEFSSRGQAVADGIPPFTVRLRSRRGRVRARVVLEDGTPLRLLPATPQRRRARARCSARTR